MLSRAAKNSSLIPSQNALRVLRQLALAGSTVGGFCTVAALTYEAHRRVRIAEKIIETKRTLHSTAPNYDATSAAKRLKVMVEAAEAGEFLGIESLELRNRNASDTPGASKTEPEKPAQKLSKKKYLVSLEKHHSRWRRALLQEQKMALFNHEAPTNNPSLARNAEVRSQEERHDEEAKTSGKVPFETEIRRLLIQEKEITAANLFLAHSRWTPSISWERRELGCLLFTANCVKGNIYTARSLFNCLNKISIVSSEMWATLMHLLAKEGHIDSVGTIYERFKTQFEVPTHLLEVILRCLIESKRLDSAKSFFFNRIEEDRDCGLCGAFLDGLWRKTRSIELLSFQLGLILERLELLGRKPTEKLFNPMVKAMVETGRAEEAEAMVKGMSTRYGVQPGCRTVGMIIYSRALNCEWDRVMDGLRAMHEHGYSDSKKDFAIVFDRVFLEYYPAHTGQQILDFVISCINDFEIQPDRVLHRHIIEAIIEKGTEDMLATIMEMADVQQWNTCINTGYITDLMKRRKIAMMDAPVGIWRLKQASNQRQSHLSSSRRILGSSSAGWEVREHKLAPIHSSAEETYPRTVSQLVAKKTPTLYLPLDKRMEQMINLGQNMDALGMYDHAVRNGYVARPIHLTLAVIAAILSCKRTGLANARRLITSEWEHWKNDRSLRFSKRFTPWTPIFFQRVMKVDPGAVGRGGLIKMAIFEYYNLCANSHGLSVKHFCAASFSHYLIKSGTPELAVDLLTTLYQSRWRLSHGFDQVLLKLLLRAFGELRDLKGAWWCIMTVLSRSEQIKPEFVAEAGSQFTVLEEALMSSASNETAEQISILRRTVDVLEAKSQGDPHWSPIHVQPTRKDLGRSNPPRVDGGKQHLLPTTDLEQLIPCFDEEWELDRLLKGDQFTASNRYQWWDESVLSKSHSVLPEDPQYPSFTPETWDDYYVPEKYSSEYHLEFSPVEEEYNY